MAHTHAHSSSTKWIQWAFKRGRANAHTKLGRESGGQLGDQKEEDGVDLMKAHYYIHAWILNEKNKVFILGQNMQFAFLPCFGFVSFACLFLRHIP